MADVVDRTQTARAYSTAVAIAMAPLLVNGYVDSKVATRWPVGFWVFDLFIWVVLPAAVLVCLKRATAMRLADLGFSASIFGRRSTSLVVAVSIVFIPIAYLGYSVPKAILAFPDIGIFQYQSMVPPTGLGSVLVPIYFALTAGVVEEIYFRGLLYKISGLTERPVLVYLALSPTLFAAVHWESGLLNTVTTFIWGWVMACAFLLTRNLWPLVLGHICTGLLLFVERAV
jgi:hypothetical protein